jgi:hypothetical protein
MENSGEIKRLLQLTQWQIFKNWPQEVVIVMKTAGRATLSMFEYKYNSDTRNIPAESNKKYPQSYHTG